MWSDLEQVYTKEKWEDSDMEYLESCSHISFIDLLVSNVKVAINDESIIVMMLLFKWIIQNFIVLTVKVVESKIGVALKVFRYVRRCVWE